MPTKRQILPAFPDLEAGGAVLFAAALSDPEKEAAHAGALPPHQAQEFSGVEIGGSRTEESFHAPAKIGALPGREAVAFGGNPVIAKRVQHIVLAICLGWHTAGF